MLMEQRAMRIIEQVGEFYGVRVADILSKDRHQHIARARRIAMRRVRGELGLSYPFIGKIFGKDHTTVMSACGMKRKR